jgi:alkylation response protein AidB-like acyl-CoA dehydrogenase
VVRSETWQFVSALDLLERHSNNCGIPMLTRPVRTQAQRLDALRPLLHRFRDRLRDFDAAAAFPEANFADLRAAAPLTLTIPQDLGGDGLWQADRFADYCKPEKWG